MLVATGYSDYARLLLVMTPRLRLMSMLMPLVEAVRCPKAGFR